ncbi:hypothetical protein ACHAWF_004211 [Thalassiosira exigua]
MIAPRETSARARGAGETTQRGLPPPRPPPKQNNKTRSSLARSSPKNSHFAASSPLRLFASSPRAPNAAASEPDDDDGPAWPRLPSQRDADGRADVADDPQTSTAVDTSPPPRPQSLNNRWRAGSDSHTSLSTLHFTSNARRTVARTSRSPRVMSASPKLHALSLAPGVLGVTIQQSGGRCIVTGKASLQSPFEVNDVIVSLNGVQLANVEGGLPSWTKLFQVPGVRNVVVQRFVGSGGPAPTSVPRGASAVRDSNTGKSALKSGTSVGSRAKKKTLNDSTKHNVAKKQKRDGAAPKKNSAGATSAGATSVSAAIPPPPPPSDLPVTALISMTAKELKEELKKQGKTISGGKVDLLERLGVPARGWNKLRGMKVAQLKEELKKQNKKTSGNKDDLLERLGVPRGFGETPAEKRDKEWKKKMHGWRKEGKERKARMEKARALVAAVAAQKKAATLRLEHDPTHEEYEEPCCDNRTFDFDTQPSGCINYPDGSMSEVWRCVSCGKIPKYPNKPPVIEFSTDDESGCDSYTHGRRDNECTIQ